MGERVRNWFREQATPRPADATPRTRWRGVLWGRGLRGDGFSAFSWAAYIFVGLVAIIGTLLTGHLLVAALIAVLWLPLIVNSVVRAIRAAREGNVL